MLTAEQIKILKEKDLLFSTSRSGGKGGQNVNKVESKVAVVFKIEHSLALRENQKRTLLASHSTRIRNGEIHIQSEHYRSQVQNKERCIQKLIDLLTGLLKPRKKRIPTKPGKAAKEKKLEQKKRIKVKKEFRRKIKSAE